MIQMLGSSKDLVETPGIGKSRAPFTSALMCILAWISEWKILIREIDRISSRWKYHFRNIDLDYIRTLNLSRCSLSSYKTLYRTILDKW